MGPIHKDTTRPGAVLPDALACRAPLTEPTVGPIKQRKVILIVDDHQGHLKLVKAIIQRKFGDRYEVIEATSGLDALNTHKDRIHAGEVDLLITDFHMLGMNGLELAEAMKKIKPELRVIVISGELETREGDETKRRVLDMATLFGKPCARETLTAEVERLIGSEQINGS